MTNVVSVLPSPSPTLWAASPIAPSAQTASATTQPLDITADKKVADDTVTSKPAASETTPPPPPRIVSFSDAATGILIEATQNPLTGGLVAQFPNRALIESYGKQIRLQESASPAASSARTLQVTPLAKAG